MFLEYLKALSLIFVAEMGDKTQILAMTFAMQYPIVSILTGVGIGAFLNHGIAIVLGALLMTVIPMEVMQIVAGTLFVFFAFKSLSVEDEEEVDSPLKKFGPILTVALAFFIGELGDKTQLAALGLSTDAAFPFVILLGTTSGMILTSLVGIIVGRKLGKKVPEDKLKIGAFFIFMIFGVQKLYVSYFFNQEIMYFAGFLSLMVLGGLWSIQRFRRTYALLEETVYMKKVKALKELREKSKIAAAEMCKSCVHCDQDACMIGYMKQMLVQEHAFGKKPEELLDKGFNKKYAKQMLGEIEAYDAQYGKEEVNEEIRGLMEHIA